MSVLECQVVPRMPSARLVYVRLFTAVVPWRRLVPGTGRAVLAVAADTPDIAWPALVV